MKLHPAWAILIGIILTFSPIYFLISFSVLPLGSDAPSIGTALGGLTAPFVGLIGAFLIFYTFREQQKAIAKQDKVRLAEFYKSFFDGIRSMYDQLLSSAFFINNSFYSTITSNNDAFNIYLGLLNQYHKVADYILSDNLELHHKRLLLLEIFNWYISFIQSSTNQCWQQRHQGRVLVDPVLSEAFDSAYESIQNINGRIHNFIEM